MIHEACENINFLVISFSRNIPNVMGYPLCKFGSSFYGIMIYKCLFSVFVHAPLLHYTVGGTVGLQNVIILYLYQNF